MDFSGQGSFHTSFIRRRNGRGAGEEQSRILLRLRLLTQEELSGSVSRGLRDMARVPYQLSKCPTGVCVTEKEASGGQDLGMGRYVLPRTNLKVKTTPHNCKKQSKESRQKPIMCDLEWV
jgi:hypothetical protein